MTDIRRRGATAIIVISTALMLIPGALAAGPQSIQDKLGSLVKKGQQVRDQGKQVVGQLQINDQQEQDIGAEVSARIRDRYGVVQDPAVHRYVSLVGTVLARASSRPNLPYKFIVLDTDGVNAFAAPGGYVHITRGALALCANEAELAGVLAHELTHVTDKHTLKAIQKGKLVEMAAGDRIAKGSPLFQKLVDVSTQIAMAGFGREDEIESDAKGIRLANTVGYQPAGLVDFLARLNDRNKESTSKQGLFASHPEMQERIAALRKEITGERLASTSVLPDRYHRFISYKPKAQTEIAAVDDGAAGLTGSKKKAPAPAPAPKKKGFNLAGLLAPGATEKKSAQVTGSAAARGVDKELGAPGGPVKTIVAVSLTQADIEAFRKEGRLR